MTNLDNNNNAYPDYLNVPDDYYSQDYFDSISSGLDDSFKSETVADLDLPATAPQHHQTAATPPANSRAAYLFDFFDILSKSSSDLSILASHAGIDWQKLQPQINKAQTRYTKAIALDKKSAGKVLAFVDCKTTRAGQEYPFITFFTQKHGGESFVFDGYEWLKNNGYLQGKALSESELKALENKRAERDAERAKKAEQAKQQQENSQQKTIARFNEFNARFDTLPQLTATDNTYLNKKGFTAEQLPADFVLKRGHDKRGGFIAYPLKNNHKVVGYQKIYDEKFRDFDGSERDKDFIFLPETKNGSFAILGNIQNQTDKLYLCEGFATALAVLATGKPCIIALDAGNLFYVAKVVCKAFKNVTIAADNDIGAKGNTGLYKALIAAKAFNLEVVYPELGNGEKCDFNDVFVKHGLKEVKSQLKNNKIDFSESSNYYNLLLNYCPEQNKNELEKHLKSACFIAANSLLLNNDSDIKSAALPIQEIIDNRKLSLKAENCIKWFFDKKQFEIKKANSLANIYNSFVHNFTGKNNAEIANEIRKNKKAIWLDTRPMGTGKTELMKVIADYAKQTESYKKFDKQITYIAHRVALIKDAANRLELRFYDDIAAYAGERTRTLAVCANSIINHEVAERVNILFIDEIRQTLEHILNGTCENRLEVFNALINAIKRADLVLCADADLNQFTLDFIKSIANKPIHLIETDLKKLDKKIIELKTNGELFSKIREDLLAGGNAWISTDSMSKAKTLNEFLTLDDNSDIATALKTLFSDSGLNLKEDDVLLVTSENKADIKQALFLANPNIESKKYRVIIHTPVISSGVSVTNGHFKSVYAIFCNVTAPNEMLQTIARVRTAKTIYCTFKTGHVKNRATNIKDLIEGEEIKRARWSLVYEALSNFDKLRLNQIVDKNKALNDFKPYFFLLAQQKGYDVLPYSEKTPDSESENKLNGLIKNTSAIVKEKTISGIKNEAEIIDSKEAFKLDKANALTQAQNNALKRFKICQIVGKENSPNDLTESDIDFIEFNKGAGIIANFELLEADLAELKEQDKTNHQFRDKLASKASKHLLFKTVVDGINGLKNGAFDSETAANICEFLKDNYKELASNGLGNYAKVSRYPVKQLTEFLAKCGYDVLKPERGTDGKRFYSIAPNEQVKAYAVARAYQRKLKAVDLTDM